MEQKDFYRNLVNRYVECTANEDELEVFFQLLKEGRLDEYLSEEMIKETERIQETKPAPVRRMPQRWWAAAAILLLLAAGSYFFLNHQQSKKQVAVVNKNVPVNDVGPGGNKAVLTLADGSVIILDSVQNGTLSRQGDIKIIKLDDGQLAYDRSGVKASSEVLYNTISTPKGGQYQLTLSDGSKVWLNAESSITFPAAFTGKERNVEIKGEAYFEVAHNAQMPFNVKVEDMTVHVLGTHFNINAYADESVIKTTLLQGSVKVSKGSYSKTIKPGEQALISSGDGSDIMVQTADVEEAVAWKNGLFHFDNAGLPEVMRQLSRWYDVDVVYNGAIPKREFGGEIQRNLKLSQVLELLEKNQVNFKIEGKKIIVLP